MKSWQADDGPVGFEEAEQVRSMLEQLEMKGMARGGVEVDGRLEDRGEERGGRIR